MSLVTWLLSVRSDQMTTEALKPGIHVATDCNATSRCSQLQSVWGSVASSCSQSQISDSVRYFLRRSIALQVVAPCMPGSCKLQVQELMKTSFTSFIFSPMRACRSVALQVVAACMCSSCRYLRLRFAVICYVYAGLQSVELWSKMADLVKERFENKFIGNKQILM